MDEESWEAWVRRYGLRPAATDLGEVRDMVRAETALGWDADVELMRVGCVQLFNAGALADVLTVWGAKGANFDAHCSIDIQLLCGAGLDEVKTHLWAARAYSEEATKALEYLLECEAAGDFEDFTVERWSRAMADYYETS
ncbi:MULTISPECIES: hypothetical protein [Pseudofrankia]|uniref:hypothetical protein n=1 Tax=Pseudofrankia TaxID=2994363 RepID=UPI000234DB20|nr:MULTISPECIES: hypothetical protein [Pseudofrankia]OHV32831.1 hypothetical protein BCD49_28775 [Pseudofrankia sp. EUN1h]